MDSLSFSWVIYLAKPAWAGWSITVGAEQPQNQAASIFPGLLLSGVSYKSIFPSFKVVGL